MINSNELQCINVNYNSVVNYWNTVDIIKTRLKEFIYFNSKPNLSLSIYGAGRSGLFVYENIKEIIELNNIKFNGFIVTKNEGKEKKFLGFKLKDISKLSNKNTDLIICALNNKYYGDIISKLKEINFSLNKVLFLYSHKYIPMNKIFITAPYGYEYGYDFIFKVLNNLLNKEFNYSRKQNTERFGNVYNRQKYGNTLLDLKIGDYMMNYFEYIPEIKNFYISKNTKLILITRDIRELIYLNLKKHYYELKAPFKIIKECSKFLDILIKNDPVKQKEYFKKFDKIEIEQRSFENYIDYELPNITKFYKTYFNKWLKIKNLFILKLENLSENSMTLLQNTFKYLDIPISNYQVLKHVYEQIESKKVDLSINNEYLLNFNKKQKLFLKKEIGDLLIKLNYEKDINW